MRKKRPSRTAKKVALNIVALGSKRGMNKILPAGIVDATVELMIASKAATLKEVRLSRSPKILWLYKAFDWMLPGQFEAFAYRKAFCYRQAREGISEGATQVLTLGAGYDTLGWQLSAEYPEVNFFEIDHPATSSLKAKGIEKMGQRDNLFLLAEDLGEQNLVDVIKAQSAWDSSAKSVVLAEGLLMYLQPEAVRLLFDHCFKVTGSGSRIGFTYVGKGADGRPDVGRWTGLDLWFLKISGEPWYWSIKPEELSDFLQETGWINAPELIGTANKHGVEYFGVAKK